jgi:adenine-specific DNA-methyltransferase
LISGSHDHVLVVAKEIGRWQRNLLPREGASLSAFKNPDSDFRGLWQSVAYSVQSEDAERRKPYRYPIRLPSGREVMPPSGRHWNGLPDRTAQLRKENRLWFGKDGDSPPRLKVFLSEVQDGIVPDTWWPHESAGSNQDSKKEMLELFPDVEPFATPKPEKLLERILTIATNPGDLVLDSFAGSGTTGAVAHKLGRRWIMVELEETCHTHIIPRMRKVVDGEDLGGVSSSAKWEGGGGFRYCRLAGSLIVNDRWGNPVINPEYNAAQLAEALAKLEGFTYSPSETSWWQHGHSSEHDFIYTTTQNLSADQLQALSEEVGSERSLLVCCSAFRGVTAVRASECWPNLTLKKIPKMVLARCEWGHDDYSLNVANLPMAKPEPVESLAAAAANKKTKIRKLPAGQGGLFGESE